MTLTLDLSQPVDISIEQRPDFYSDLDPAAPSNDYNSDLDGMLTFTRPVYDQQAIVALIQPKVVVSDDVDEGFFSDLGELFSNYFGAQFLLLVHSPRSSWNRIRPPFVPN